MKKNTDVREEGFMLVHVCSAICASWQGTHSAAEFSMSQQNKQGTLEFHCHLPSLPLLCLAPAHEIALPHA